ncbi:MAG: LD-carboxypeptidase [Marinilabiliaceae bacterium]|nr:LD-carboxypeptidase [Marinilabiliaceae bacterium]
MKFPHFLTPKSQIGLVAPAGKTTSEVVKAAISLLSAKGFKVVIGNHILDSHYQMAGTDSDRLSDLQSFLNRDDIDAIFCLRGGYGSIRIIEQLNFSSFINKPKWIVGFSDITNLHSILQNVYSIASMHALMPVNYKPGKKMPDFEMLIDLLTGKSQSISVSPHPFNKTGSAEGQLIGGNLSILHSLRGTPMDIKADGKILFIEDVGEYLYKIDRMIHTFKLGGTFEKISALIVGQFTNMLDNDMPFGQTVYEIIKHSIKDYSFPVLYNYPAGHSSPNYPLVFGKTVTLEVTENSSTLKM